MDLGNNAKALEHLKSAADHTIAFDNNFTDHFNLYTSPLINKAYYGGLITSQQGNQSYNLLKNLDNEKYNALCDTPEFKEICEELKKHASVDEKL